VLASVLHTDLPAPIAIISGLVVGLVCGLVNGLLITFGRLPPFISTLGIMSVARGAALLYSNGRPISGFSPLFRFLATGEVFHIPMPVIIMIFVYGIAHFVLTKTKLGRYTYAIGGNEEAALLSGVNVKLNKAAVYGICGMLSGLAAVILTARLNSAQPIAGIMYELDAIAATVIGGTSLMGGEGTIVGTLIGAFIMGVLRNGLNLLGVSSFIQQIVIGSVIIIAVLVDMALKKRNR
jgi:ribose/xylose/arabinose/galactoside ABC-type transport system permease subunit